MRVVLDTNVVVSAFLRRDGNCGLALERVARGDLKLCVDPRILYEYDLVLKRPRFKFEAAWIEDFFEMVEDAAEMVEAPALDVKLPDPKDLMFLEVAAAAAALLVTGNLKDFPKDRCGGVRVVSPAEFVRLIGA